MGKMTVEIGEYDYVEFYVGSAKMSAYWYANALGMTISGYRGPETGVRDRVSYYLTQGDIRIVLTSPLSPGTHEVGAFVATHGDGVKRWAVSTVNVPDTFDRAIKNGAIPITFPHRQEDDHGVVEEAAIRLYDDTEIVFCNRSRYRGVFKPGFGPFSGAGVLKCRRVGDPGLLKIDHMVGNVRVNEMERWADYFIECLGFESMLYFGPGDISTPYSALLSRVVRSPGYRIKNPINEPHEGRKVSQIEEYVNEYHGSGVQHIALLTDDIIATVSALRENGMEFLDVPDSYYEGLVKKNAALDRHRRITEDMDRLRDLKILCDLEGSGYLLQIFTKPIGDRPTFFFEVIQRKQGAMGFGHGNFLSLFKAIEHEQEKRGNLDRQPPAR